VITPDLVPDALADAHDDDDVRQATIRVPRTVECRARPRLVLSRRSVRQTVVRA
jgi:hypothetical protein